MARIINGTLFVSSYNSTANPGEYTFTNAIYTNVTDATGNGAFDLDSTFVLFVPAADPNTFDPVPGVSHRFKFTALAVVDASHINGTILWDEGGLEVDKPLNGALAVISEKGAGLGLGYAVSQAVYPNIPSGSDLGSVVVDSRVKIDPATGGGNPYTGTGSFILTNTFRKSTPPDTNGNSTAERFDALAYDGTYLWAHSGGNNLIKLNVDGSEIARYTSPTSNDVIMLVQGGFLWMVSQNGSALYKVSLTTGAAVASYFSGFTAVAGDGTYLYPAYSGRVFKFDPATGTMNNLFEQATAFSPDDFATDGTNLWAIDRTVSQVKRITNGPVYATYANFENTFIAVTPGAAGNSITITFIYDVVAGSEYVAVSGNDITFHVQNNVTTQEVFYDLVAAYGPASALIRVELTRPYVTHSYGVVTSQPLAGGQDFVVASIDVSASGTPNAIIFSVGYVWVAMSNGDLLKIDTADTVVATYPSGATALGGLCADPSSYFIYVVETAPGSKIRRFDLNYNYFVDDLASGNTPDDVVWNNDLAPGNLWAINRASSTIRRLNAKTGALLGTIDVSASGTPRRGQYDTTNTCVWVAMSNGDLLKINPSTDVVDATYSSGQAGLNGVSQSSGSALYVSYATGKKVIKFNIGANTFDTPLDFSTINTPDDIAWDTSAQLWSLDFASTTIQRTDTSGSVLGTVSVASDGGFPKRMSSSVGSPFGNYMLVTMDTGHLVLVDSYGTGNIFRTFFTGTTALSGIAYLGSSTAFLSKASGGSNLMRFFIDGGAAFHDVIRTMILGDAADNVSFAGIWLWTIKYGTGAIKKVSLFDGSTLASIDISGQGLPKDINNSSLLTLANGKMLTFATGYQTEFATVSLNGITYRATGPGDGGNQQSVQITSGSLGNYTWDGQHLSVEVNPGVTTAQQLGDFVNSIAYFTGVPATINSPSTTQPVTAQTFMTGGGDSAPSIANVVVSEKSALAGLSDSATGLGFVVGFTSPTTGFMRFSGTFFDYLGSRYPGGYYIDSVAVGGANLWVSDQGNYPYNDSRKVLISTMTPEPKPVRGLNYYAFGVAFLNGYAYYGDDNYPLVHKVDPATHRVIQNIGIGDQAYGNNYEWGGGLYSDGTSIWAPTIFSGFGGDTRRSMDKLDLTGRVVAALYGFDTDVSGNWIAMVKSGDYLFAGSNYNLLKFKINL